MLNPKTAERIIDHVGRAFPLGSDIRETKAFRAEIVRLVDFVNRNDNAGLEAELDLLDRELSCGKGTPATLAARAEVAGVPQAEAIHARLQYRPMPRP